jgi:hypothetical protein
LFGEQLGLAEVTDFAYQATVIPSVTTAELNLDILGKVESSMGDLFLAQLFDQCSIDANPPVQSKMVSEVQQESSTKGWFDPRNKNDNGGGRQRRQLRFLQGTSGGLGGFSTRPRDTVVEGGMLLFIEYNG